MASVEQLSLFADAKEIFAKNVCNEFNMLDTVWKDQFYVKEARLEWWNHVQLKRKVLFICLKAKNWSDQNTFIQFAGDRKSQLNLYNASYFSKYLADLEKDKDFSISITPWCVYVYYHNFEVKRV